MQYVTARIYDNDGHAQFVTFGCYRRRRQLDHPIMRDAVLSIFKGKLEQYRTHCSGFVIMPDHLHAILCFPGPNMLSDFMKAWKQTSSLHLKKLMRGMLPNYSATYSRSEPFWQAKYYPFNLFSERKAKEKLDYMHLNPVRAGLVERAIDWKWSSARYFELGEECCVPLSWVF